MNHNSRTKRGAKLLTAVLVSVGLLAACSGTAPATDPDAPVTIDWWHIQTGDPTQAIWDDIANEYMELHPNVTIKQTALANEDFKAKLATAMQAGDPPDIFHSWGGGTLVDYGEAGLVQDLTDSLAGDWGDSISPAALGMNSGGDGKVWAVPFSLSGVGIWYNKALFAQAGITDVPTTWPEFLDAVDALKAAGITPIALGNKEKWPGMYWYSYLALRAGGRDAFEAAADRSGSFDSPAFIEAGERVQELIDAGAFSEGFQGLDYGAQEVQMGSGLAAMELMGDWSPSVQIASDPDQKGLGDDLGFMAFPTLPGGDGEDGDMLAGTASYAVGKDAPAAAIDFLEFFTNAEHEGEFASQGLFLTTVKGTDANVKDPNLQQVQKAIIAAPYLQNFYDQVLPQSVAVPLVDAITGVFAGSSTPEEAAAAIEAAAKQFLD